MTELKETFDPFSAAMDTLAAWVEPDPISARIDSYLAVLSALDARYRADLAALYTAFQGDIVVLVQPPVRVEFDQRVNTLIEEALRKVVKGAYPHAR